MAFQIAADDGEGSAVVFHEIIADAVAEDHGGVPGEFAIEKDRGRPSVGLVEDGNCRSGFDAVWRM